MEKIFIQYFEITLLSSVLIIFVLLGSQLMKRHITYRVKYMIFLILTVRLLIPYGVPIFPVPNSILLVNNENGSNFYNANDNRRLNSNYNNQSYEIESNEAENKNDYKAVENNITNRNSENNTKNNTTENKIKENKIKENNSSKQITDPNTKNYTSSKEISKNSVSTYDDAKTMDQNNNSISLFINSIKTKGVIIFTLLWITGVIIYLSYHLLIYHFYFNKIKKSMISVKDVNIIQLYTVIKNNKNIKKNISLNYSNEMNSPMLIGFFNPILLITKNSYTEKEMEYILEHELIHYIRKDHLLKFLLLLVRGIHFYNPFVHIMVKQIDEDMELLCDYAVLSKKKSEDCDQYCDMILKTVRNQIVKKSLLTTGFSTDKNQLKRRLSKILITKEEGESKKFQPLAILLVIIITSISLIACNNHTNEGDTTNNNQSNEKQDTNNMQIDSPTINDNNTVIGIKEVNKIKKLYSLKTPYVGDASKVSEIAHSLDMPDCLSWLSLELDTDKTPYGATFNYKITDYEGIENKDAINDRQLIKNAVLIFALIENVDTISFHLEDGVDYPGASYSYSYHRTEIEKIIGMKINDETKEYQSFYDFYCKIKKLDYEDLTSTKENIDVINYTEEDKNKIEELLSTIQSSDLSSSNPADYINKHNLEYENIIKMGDIALSYCLQQFKEGNIEGLRGQLLKRICVELLGYQNNVEDWETLSPKEWYQKLEINDASILPEFIYTKIINVEKQKYIYSNNEELNIAYNFFNSQNDREDINLVYLASYYRYHKNMSGNKIATIVAPILYGSETKGDRINLFATVFIGEYMLYGDKIYLISGSVIPCKISYKNDKDKKEYRLIDYEEAGDGSYFAKSIREFCGEQKEIANKMIDDYNSDHIQKVMIQNLYEYVKVNKLKVKYYNLNGEDIPME